MREAAGLPARLSLLTETARDIATSVVAEEVEHVDGDARWPRRAMQTLGDAGLLGLNVDAEVGGRGEGLLALALVTEELGRVCASTGLVFGMHCVAAKVIDVKATEDQRKGYLAAIAAGEHVTSLALSEPGTGVHFYLPRVTYRRADGHFVVNGRKSFVTSGGEADSYVLSVVGEDAELDPGTFSCLLLDAGTAGASWQGAWNGFGMRGNSSRGLLLEDAPVPVENLLGAVGDETWYVFEVIAPYFIVAMAGTYLGVARAALEGTIDHLRKRAYDHTGEPIGTSETIAHRLGGLWATVERSRQLLHHAAASGDRGDPAARNALFASKAEIADAAVHVANEALTLTGGAAYQANGALTRALRDARAAHVMSPSTDLLKSWLGRSLLDLPLL
ncbi:acyl-CoA dehydrogenase family protein [Egicoccus sp. AB-alg2]|uniref:acyl-CoA dehydrogenase family protein n=1 Tax=Egicoccus sp. AB-alg2 TaxID=3242693 RepID=UPI00359DFCFD